MLKDEPAETVFDLAARAEDVAARLHELANGKRLMILCHLAGLEMNPSAEPGAAPGEASVGAINGVVDLSQSALSQHLARLRAAGIVATRRQGQTIFYRLADPEIRRLMASLYEIFCGEG